MLRAVPLDEIPDPLALLERVASLRLPAFLDSAAPGEGLGRWSYLAWDPVALVEGDAGDWPAVRGRLRATIAGSAPPPGLPPFVGGWIGWFGYELGRAFDRQPVAAADPIGVPDVSLALYDVVVAWDLESGRAWVLSSGIDATGAADAGRAERRLAGALAVLDGVAGLPPPEEPGPDPVAVTAGTRPEAYRTAVDRTIEAIRDGEIFQANLTQRFRLPFDGNRTALYRRMRALAPGSHAAYLDRGRIAALSMSPERFLSHDSGSRRVETRPIKGTRPRGADPGRDAANAAALRESTKDRAENVMIVDLLRNDLARVAEPASIRVVALCQLESYAAVHHLVSVVEARLAPGRDALDLLEASFPGGSITGAPKLRAMELLATLEPERRGIYCGAIGWIGLDGSLELSIAIRTATVSGGEVVIGAGGGITLLSDAEEEYREMLDKAGALLRAAGGSP